MVEPEEENTYLSELLTNAIQGGNQAEAQAILQLLQEIDATIEVIEVDSAQVQTQQASSLPNIGAQQIPYRQA